MRRAGRLRLRLEIAHDVEELVVDVRAVGEHGFHLCIDSSEACRFERGANIRIPGRGTAARPRRAAHAASWADFCKKTKQNNRSVKYLQQAKQERREQNSVLVDLCLLRCVGRLWGSRAVVTSSRIHDCLNAAGKLGFVEWRQQIKESKGVASPARVMQWYLMVRKPVSEEVRKIAQATEKLQVTFVPRAKHGNKLARSRLNNQGNELDGKVSN